MRVALFSGNYNYLREGANQALNRLVRYLEEKADCTVRVYSPVTDTPAFDPAGTLVPVPSVPLPVRGEFQLALGLPRAIADNVAQFDPQIIHVSTPDILGVRAQTLAKKMGVPVLASMHTHFETYLDFYNLGWARPLIESHLNRFYRRSNHVVAPTEGLVAKMKQLRGDDCASVWSRGIDHDLFHPKMRDDGWRQAHGIAKDEIVVLFFGRLVLEKGIDIFLDVIRELQKRAPVRPLIVGAGPASDSFNSIPGTILTGHLEGRDLARAVASADMMVTPSITETFGNVVLEAMASGLPVISADALSARSLIADGQTGILCPPRNVAAYVEAVMHLIDAPDIRRQMGALAHTASTAYTWDAASESVANVYRALVGKLRVIHRLKN